MLSHTCQSHFVWVNPANIFTYCAMCHGNFKTRLINLSLPTSADLLFASEEKLHLVSISVSLETKQEKTVNLSSLFPFKFSSISKQLFFYLDINF